jgi:hypothetical protein
LNDLKTTNYEGIIEPVASNSLLKQTSVEQVSVNISYGLHCGAVPITKAKCNDNETLCSFKYDHNSRTITFTGTIMKDYDNIDDIPCVSQMKYIENINFGSLQDIGKKTFFGSE